MTIRWLKNIRLSVLTENELKNHNKNQQLGRGQESKREDIYARFLDFNSEVIKMVRSK